MDTEVVQAPKFRRPSFIRAVMRLRLGRAGFSLALFLIFVVQLPPSSPLLLSIPFPLCVSVRPEPRAAADARHPSKNAECGIRDGEWDAQMADDTCRMAAGVTQVQFLYIGDRRDRPCRASAMLPIFRRNRPTFYTFVD